MTARLAAQAGAGLSWNLAGGLARALSGLAINTALARMLGPEPFGQVALAAVVIGLGSLLVDSGFSVSLIRKPQLDELDIRSAFTAQLALGVALAAALAVLAPWAGVLLAQDSVTPVLRVLAVLLAVQAFGQTSTALLRRAGDFRRVQQAQIASYLAAYLAVGLPLARYGGGVWSLVAAQLTQAALYSGAVWMATRHSLRPYAGRRARTEPGLTITASNVAAWAVGALPALLIGRFQGVLMLGHFSRAFFLVNMPASILAAGLQTTSLTVYARLQRHHRLTARTCLGLAALCLMATVPPYFAAAAMPGTIVTALFGEQWLPMGQFVTPLALAMPFECAAALSGPLLIARGLPGRELQVQTLTAASTLVAVGGLSAWASPAAAAWGVLVSVYLVRFALALGAMGRVTGISGDRWARAVAGPLALGAGCFTAVKLLEPYLAGQGLGPWGRLMLLGSLATMPVGMILLRARVRGTDGRNWAAKVMAAYV